MAQSGFVASLGSPRAIGVTTFLISIPIGVVATLAASQNPVSSPSVLGSWLVISVLSHAGLGAVLLLGNRVRRHFAETTLRSRITVGIVTIAASAMRGLVLALLSEAWNLPTTATGFVRVLSSALIFSAWLTIVGAVLAASDRFRAEIATLCDDLVARALQSRYLDRSVSEPHTAAAVRRIAESAGPLGTALNDGSATDDYHRTAAIITAAIDERLRPLSHEMWFTKAPVLGYPRTIRSFLAKVWRIPVPYHRAVPLMTLFLVVNSSVWHGGSVGFVHGAVASVIVAAIVLPLTVWGGSRRLAANVVMYGALATIPLIVSTTVDAAFFGAQVFQPIMLTMAVGIPVGFWLGAAAQAVVGDRATTISELRELSLEPDWQAHVELMHRHAAEAAAATFLHGTIQSRLTAAALQLKSAATNNDIVRAEAAVELALSAVALASQTQTEAPQRNPIARLEALAIAWTGIATIDLRVEVTEENDQRYAVAWMLVADAVEEGVTNAIRHGKASHVWVTAHAVDGAIEATITDDGLWKNNPTSTQSRGARGTSVPSSGIGLTLINRISEGNWSAVESSEGTTILLRVRV